MASDDRVETRAVVRGHDADMTFRRGGDESIWIKTTLDKDGEFCLSLQHLGQALRVLGFNRADLFPDG